jgi:hypothetical protein
MFSRGITLSKNHQTMTKFELDLHNPKMYPYTKFELDVCNCSRDNERKPIFWNDVMTKGNTICPWPFHDGHNKNNEEWIEDLILIRLVTTFI